MIKLMSWISETALACIQEQVRKFTCLLTPAFLDYVPAKVRKIGILLERAICLQQKITDLSLEPYVL
jgi:hypothetical protein